MGSWRMPVGAGNWDNQMNWDKEVWRQGLRDQLEMGAGKKMGKSLKLVLYYRASTLDLEGRKER